MASLPAPTFEGIKKMLAQKRPANVYVLHGEEGYFIDALAKEFEEFLPEEERVFNQYVLYGPDTAPAQILDVCRRIPMMADYQLVILKEAQAWSADMFDKIAPYLAEPTPSTIFVLCCRGAVIKGKEIKSALKKGGAVVFESKKVYENQAPAYIADYIKQRGLSAEQKALGMLVDFVGTDLSRLFNEVDKLASILPPGSAVTPEAVERHIGVSKEYNSFELVDAFAAHDSSKVFRILNYFRSNPKAAPLVMVTASLFNYFSDLMVAYYVPGRNPKDIAEALKITNRFALNRVLSGMKHYNPYKIIECLEAIRRFDACSKGVESRMNEHDLFHELAYHILSAPGRL
ncbi:MAG: DNA polymerase III subunit delta [Muribaculaceae bacterium]|nr:DNA polymerase III subunit delta [Muribaculaceae bacterium]